MGFAHFHAKRFRTQPCPPALRTVHRIAVFRQNFTPCIAMRHETLQQIHHPGPVGITACAFVQRPIEACSAHEIPAQTSCSVHTPRFAMKKGFFGFFAEIFQRRIQRETMPPAQFRKRFFYLLPCIRAGKRRQCPLGKGQAFIRRDKLGIERRHSAYACALRASPLRAVERKKLRREPALSYGI